jgi:uncharacterized protein YbaR (Trm112 family)
MKFEPFEDIKATNREPDNLNSFIFVLSASTINTRKVIMALSDELLNILACPKCKGDIYINDTNDGLICDNCKLLYEIRDDIPIMLIDEAKSIDSLK